ncbi:MAG: hypothetical protein COW88_02965 [Candidatus Lloydbacteria bacterium CG22_combo_CG10-13_8_21_14_all_47_15]|uniref:DUF4145 domain-containing protein n=1 Tax=Candidatus Lloydbacteria bacterium CG22_combo_CG10-13_8_21_14_all_47_15 TaxID=1974635 RepID=A0A2H0CTW0_9BACT|nr:MAG: hypothetical protein COW88_02965 [Candidatus Lloydbacteria bacterium CG22_combo_CG10-13_8_21_14_all_47_15]
MFEAPFINLEYLFNRLILFFSTLGGLVGEGSVPEYVPAVLLVFSFFFIAGSALVGYRIYELREKERERYRSVKVAEEPDGGEIYARWKTILTQADSENPSDWKLAILEADIILDEMVVKIGYQGENLGERLKNVEISDFTTLPSAWEAHKVRNRIAHEGDQFVLTGRDTRRVIGLYEKVFSEFKYI